MSRSGCQHYHLLPVFTKWVLLIGLLWLLGSPPVQAEAVDQDLQQWSVVTLQTDALPGRLRGSLELQPRTSLTSGQVERLFVRVGAGYQINKVWSVWQGYAWTPVTNPEFVDEHRIWQGVQAEHTLRQLSLTHRLRLEERFIDDTQGISVRARYLVRAVHPLPWGQSRGKRWYVTGYNETMINLTSVENGPQAGFHQNRLFGGLGRRLGEKVRVEGGYLLDYTNNQGNADRINHVLLLAVTASF